MRKILTLFLALALVFAFAGCAADDMNTGKDNAVDNAVGDADGDVADNNSEDGVIDENGADTGVTDRPAEATATPDGNNGTNDTDVTVSPKDSATPQ